MHGNWRVALLSATRENLHAARENPAQPKINKYSSVYMSKKKVLKKYQEISDIHLNNIF